MNTQSLLSYRKSNFLGLVICSASLAYTSVHLHQTLQLADCALCVQVRLLLLICAVIFFLCFLFNTRQISQRFFSLINIFTILTAITILLKHKWMQISNQDPALLCSGGLESIIGILKNINNFDYTLSEQTSCLLDQAVYLGLTVPEQALILFCLLLILCWKQLIKKAKPTSLFI